VIIDHSAVGNHRVGIYQVGKHERNRAKVGNSNRVLPFLACRITEMPE
jgi:hypothetical protein